MDSVATSTVKTCIHTIRFSPAGSFFLGRGKREEKKKKWGKPVRTPLHQ